MSEGGTERYKIWRATSEAEAGFMVTPDLVSMSGNKNNSIIVDKSGVSVAADSVSFNCMSDNERHGGMFVKQNDFIQMVPKTITTPIPSQMPFPPFGMIMGIMKDLPVFLAALG
jgi:hypothetical protein